jgi:hypothetical protein
MRKIRSFEDLAKQVKMAKGRCHVISLEGWHVALYIWHVDCTDANMALYGWWHGIVLSWHMVVQMMTWNYTNNGCGSTTLFRARTLSRVLLYKGVLCPKNWAEFFYAMFSILIESM